MPLPSPSELAANAQGAAAAASSLPANAQAAWTNATSPANVQATKAAGAAAAAGLIANGYDSSNPADNQALIQTVAGAAAFIPPPGVFSGAIELLDAFGTQVLAPLLVSLGLQQKPGCVHSGAEVTPGDILSRMQALGARVVPGAFSSLIFPALAYYAAEALNCRPSMPPAYVLAGCVALWNSLAAGPVIAYNDAIGNEAFSPTAFFGYDGTPFGGPLQGKPPDLSLIFQPSGVPVTMIQGGLVPGLLLRAGPLAPTTARAPASAARAWAYVGASALLLVLGTLGSVLLTAHYEKGARTKGDRF